MSGGILNLIDKRVHSMIPELSPGVIIAILSSFRRIGVNANMIPLCSKDLVTQVSSLACTLDIRTFLLSTRALAGMGFSWQTLNNDQRIGIAAGIARAATANPTKLPSILLVLVELKATWEDIHEKIPVVLRYVVFKVFASVRPPESMTSEERKSTLLYLEAVLKLFVDMKASWNLIGDKAGITILQALSVLRLEQNEEYSIIPLVSAIFCDISPKVHDAVPLEFHFLFFIKNHGIIQIPLTNKGITS